MTDDKTDHKTDRNNLPTLSKKLRNTLSDLQEVELILSELSEEHRKVIYDLIVNQEKQKK